MPTSIFADEWRDCLRAHYTTVIRNDDRLTERTLRGVMMHEAGFTEDELKELQVRATAHVDDMPADFVPDLEILREEVPVSVAVAMPQEVIHAMVVEDALEHDAAADALVEEAVESAEAEMLADDTLDMEALSGDAEMFVDDVPDAEDLSGDTELMLEEALESDMTTAELLAADTLDMDESELLDGDDSDEGMDGDAPEDEPPLDPDATQLSLF